MADLARGISAVLCFSSIAVYSGEIGTKPLGWTHAKLAGCQNPGVAATKAKWRSLSLKTRPVRTGRTLKVGSQCLVEASAGSSYRSVEHGADGNVRELTADDSARSLEDFVKENPCSVRSMHLAGPLLRVKSECLPVDVEHHNHLCDNISMLTNRTIQ